MSTTHSSTDDKEAVTPIPAVKSAAKSTKSSASSSEASTKVSDASTKHSSKQQDVEPVEAPNLPRRH